MEFGVIPAANMLPEVAYVKLTWALVLSSNYHEAKRTMLTPVAGEITEHVPSNGYLIFQGGIPKLEEFIPSKENRLLNYWPNSFIV